MPGGFNPSPLRYGASRHTVFETVMKALAAGDGTAFNETQASFNYCENFTIARAIANLWSENKRLANQWDPKRMTDFLPRWEKILGISPIPGATQAARRVAVGVKLATIGKPGTQQVVNDLLTQLLGPVYVGLVNTTTAQANAFAELGPFTIPGGITAALGPWSSGVSYLAIHLQQPGGMTNAVFYATAAQVYQFLDGLLPAWTTFAWFRNNNAGVQGFTLDDAANLDNEAFGA